jgi:hypothetical protein
VTLVAETDTEVSVVVSVVEELRVVDVSVSVSEVVELNVVLVHSQIMPGKGSEGLMVVSKFK